MPRSLKSILISGLFVFGGSAFAQPSPDLSTDANLRAFYQATLLDGQVRQLGYETEVQLAQVLDDLVHHPERITATPWMGSMFPNYQVRRFIYERDLNKMHKPPLLQNEGGIYSLDSKSTRKAFLESPAPGIRLVNEPEPYPDNAYENVTQNRDPGVTRFAAVRYGVCVGMSPANARLCKKMLDEMIELMNPVESLTALSMVKEVLDNPDYAEGAAKAALKMMAKVDSIDPSRAHQTFGDFYTDIYESYRECGIAEDKIETMTWNLIAVYSSRAANIYRLYPFAANVQGIRTLVALGTIASTVSVLDSVSYTSGVLYSLPKSVKTFANYGKPYHFWMAAFLSRMMHLRYQNVSAAIAVAAIAETGYQIFSNTSGRENLLGQIVTVSPFSVRANKTRLDLGFGYGGGVYGTFAADHQEKHFSLDLNRVTRRAFENLGTPKPMTEAEYARSEMASTLSYARYRPYVKWMKYIKPIGLLRLIKEQSVCEDLMDPLDENLPSVL